jgi:uncharacterized peroxidase-related enzyme
MPRIKPIDPSIATGDTATQLAAARNMFGRDVNLIRTAANSPAAVGAMVSFFASLGAGSLGGRTGELIAIAIAQANGCDYCLSAHTAVGALHGLTVDALAAARHARASDPKVEAMLTFAVRVNEVRGRIDDAALASARAAGLSDADLVEVIAHVALSVFTNYLNNVARTAVDFPEVRASAAA